MKNLLLLAFSASLIGGANAATVFADDFSEADGTDVSGKAPDVGNPWTGSSVLLASGRLDTSGAARTVFGSFTSALGAGQVLTLTYDTFAVGGGNFFGGGYAGVSLYTAGEERVFTGDTGAGAFWGVDGGAINSAPFISSDDTATTTATFTYFYDTGNWTFATTSGVDFSGTAAVADAFDELRIANGAGGDIAVDNINVDISAIPEPASLFLLGLGAVGSCMRRQRRA